MVVELSHPDGASTRGPGNPIKLSRTSEESFTPAPALGAQTDAVMSGLLDLGAEEIRRLREEGIIG
jgi:crotonobetainyl-CoA:carnitine CoA-transferase CaiB-like acyl-CoA transferase